MYDIIGDIHGYCTKLKQLLGKLGYTEVGGIWQHSERKVIFVGDYIDRGPEIRETLQLVRSMMEAGNAHALMGNHEYNAIAFATAIDVEEYLRSHNTMHTKQHSATLEQFDSRADEWRSYLDWMYTLPLYLDLGELRIVHACWDEDHIQWLKDHGYHSVLTEELLFASHDRSSHAYTVINDLLKGKEINIPEKYAWYDKDGHARTANRVKWWINPAHAEYGNFLFNCPPSMVLEKPPADIKVRIYPETAPPVFFGHYWLEDKLPAIQAQNVICLDYSVAKNGSLVAYRWSGERVLEDKNFVWV